GLHGVSGPGRLRPGSRAEQRHTGHRQDAQGRQAQRTVHRGAFDITRRSPAAARCEDASVPRSPLADLPREVGVLVVVAFFVALGFGIVAPALPLFAKTFGVSTGAAAAVISAFAFMRIAFAFPTGRLIDRVGERLVLATGIAIVAVSSLFAG